MRLPHTSFARRAVALSMGLGTNEDVPPDPRNVARSDGYVSKPTFFVSQMLLPYCGVKRTQQTSRRCDCSPTYLPYSLRSPGPETAGEVDMKRVAIVGSGLAGMSLDLNPAGR